MTVGERIYYCRMENHMTQKELGEKAGIDPSTIRKYESGRLNPKIGTLRKIAEALGCKLTDLDETLALQEAVDNISKTLATIPEISNLSKLGSELMKAAYGTTDRDEAYRIVTDRWIQSLGEEDRESVYAVLKGLQKLNSTGKQVAADRVQELAQIPAYQRQPEGPQAAAQDVAVDPDNE